MAIEKFEGNFAKEDSGCTIIVNSTIQSIKDPKILGLYVYLLSKPSSWNIHYKEIMRHFHCSKDSAYKMLNGLMSLNLMSRESFRDEGQFVKFTYTLFLRPRASTGDSPFPPKPELVNKETYKTKKLLLESKETTISESDDSPAAAPKPKNSNHELMELIDIYRQVFPDNPQPHKRVIATRLRTALATLRNRWPELDPEGKPLTLDAFTLYLTLLKTRAPRFSLGEYTTPDGRTKKNSLETFVRWNTVVKFLEDSYS